MRINQLALSLAIAVVVGAGFAGTASAQSSLGGSSQTEFGGRPAPGNPSDPINAEGRRDTSASRVRGARRARTAPVAAAPTAEELIALAQPLATGANVECQVTEAVALGVNAESQPVFEAACATGPGYILVGATPPQATDCVLLAGQADITRQQNPAADVGLICTMPMNTDVTRVVRGYAETAGVTCSVDEGASIGRSGEGNLIYEVGCADADGYWLERVGDGWTKTTCLQVQAQQGNCRFTTLADQAASMKATLAGSEAAACDVTQARYMGANANGTFYEAKCAAGDGYIARVNAEMAVQQVYPCAEAARIGGGCTLTTVAAAPAAPAPATR